MALSMLKPNEAATNTGLTAVAHRFRSNGGLKEDASSGVERSAKAPIEGDDSSYRNFPSLNLFPTSMLAQQMLGGLSLHATLTTTPSVYAPNWFPNAAAAAASSSPPPQPQQAPRNNNNLVSSSGGGGGSGTATGGRKSSKKRASKNGESATNVDVPDSPLSPPTSGSSPQSNGSGQDIACKNAEKDKLFTCGACNRSFGYKHVLQNHERTHTGEKPFECRECHKRFTRDHHLKTHMRLHTGEKPYHCTHCDRQFVQVANLRRHLRVHTGERPYACELCSSKFSDSNQLKAHTLIHKGEKPFRCAFCLGKFRRRHHLLHHKCPNKAAADAPYHSPDEDEDDASRDTALEIDESEADYARYSPANDCDGDCAAAGPGKTSPPPAPAAAAAPPDHAPESYLVSINNNRKIRERKSRDIRRVIRVADVAVPILDPANISPMLPEQTEPEDLSMPKSKRRNRNNNDEVVNYSAPESPPSRMSRSPSLENDGLLYHPKFRRHIEMTRPM